MRKFLPVLALALLSSSVSADQKLQGSWQAVGLMDQGITIAPENIRNELAKYAQLDVEGNRVRFIAPSTNELREFTFTLDTEVNPRAITLVNDQDQVIKGIYRIDGDTFEVCLSAPDDKDRPVRFASTATSRTMLLTLKSLTPAVSAAEVVPVTTKELETKPIPAPTPTSVPNTNKLFVEALDDAQLTRRVSGTWSYRDKDSVVLISLNGDGSFNLTREFTNLANRIFAPEAQTSGVWSVEDGRIVVRVTAAWGADKRRRINQVASYRVNTISDREMIMISLTGELIRAVRKS